MGASERPSSPTVGRAAPIRAERAGPLPTGSSVVDESGGGGEKGGRAGARARGEMLAPESYGLRQAGHYSLPAHMTAASDTRGIFIVLFSRAFAQHHRTNTRMNRKIEFILWYMNF